MTKLFNFKQNSILSFLTNEVNENDSEVVEYLDSVHMFIPIKISNFLCLNQYVLLDFLRKKKVSINAFITTSDQKVLEIEKRISHISMHVKSSTPLLLSHNDFIHKYHIINNSLSNEDKENYNNEIEKMNLHDICNRPGDIKISFLELMKASNLLFFNTKTLSDSMLLFPGGRVANHDQSLMHTLSREIFEEVYIKLDVEYKPKVLIYHNIFDKLTEKFYHNILIVTPVGQSSSILNSIFRPNYEIKELKFYNIKDDRYKPIYNILLNK